MNPTGTCGLTNSSKKVYYVVSYVGIMTRNKRYTDGPSLSYGIDPRDIEKAERFTTITDAIERIAGRRNYGATVTFTIERVEETTIPGEDTVSTDLAPVDGCWYVLRSTDGAKFSLLLDCENRYGPWVENGDNIEDRFSSVEKAFRAWEKAVQRNPAVVDRPGRILRVTPGSPKVTRTITPVE